MACEDCDECCSVICCSTVGYICCCRKMKKNTKIKIIWAWLIILASTSGLILYCAVYAPNDRLASPSDMIAIRDHVNYLFCDQIKIKSPGLQFNGYLLPTNHIAIDDHMTKTTNQDTAMFVTQRDYDYFAFYLLQGSRLSIDSCAKMFMTVYVIIGAKNFDSWKEYQDCDDCYFMKKNLYQHEQCSDRAQFRNIDLYAVINEEYYIVYVNDNYEDVWVDLHVNIDRRVYDLNNASTICTETTECDLILQGPNQTPVIWIMDYYNLGENNHPKVTTECIPRIWAFLVIHGFTILLVGIIASIIVHKTHRYEYEYNRVTERSPLLYDTASPPSYSAVMRDPPKYEDIIRTCEPPTYTDAVASLQSTPIQISGDSLQNDNHVHSPQDSVHSNQGTSDDDIIVNLTNHNETPGTNDDIFVVNVNDEDIIHQPEDSNISDVQNSLIDATSSHNIISDQLCINNESINA